MHPGETLTDAIRKWPTPMACDMKGASAGAHTPNLPAVVSRLARLTSSDGESGSGPAVLNPRFVEALMGWPENWTMPRIGSVCSETESSPLKPRSPSPYSPEGSDSDLDR